MLEGELDSHWGCSKNGKLVVTMPILVMKGEIKTNYRESDIRTPCDRDASFNSIIMPQRGNMVEELEEVIVSFYVNCMRVPYIAEQIKSACKFVVSTSTIGQITAKFLDIVT